MHTVGQDDWQEAIVPGSVYTDLYLNGAISNLFWRDNAESLLSLMENDYIYQTEFDLPQGFEEAAQILLHFDGIDTIGDIDLNGVHLGNVYNMHRVWEFDVKKLGVHIRKAHCMFGWDWGAHLPDAGIFRPVQLIATDTVRLLDVLVRQVHTKDSVTLNLSVMAQGTSNPHYTVSVYNPADKCLCTEQNAASITVKNPKLWWPNGLGD